MSAPSTSPLGDRAGSGWSARTVLVTGAASGIGRAVTQLAVSRGATVVALDRDLPALEGAARDLGAGPGKLITLRCDVSSEASVEEAFAALAARDVVVDGVVTAAGIDAGGVAHELPVDVWRRVLDVNLTGTFLVCRAAIAVMLARRVPGSVVLCSSPAAFVGFAAGGTAAYSASKGGVSALTRSLALDYAAAGIRVNAIVPGPTETPLMWAAVPAVDLPAVRATVLQEVPLGRLADPSEPARAALWLLSDEASYVTGSHLVCDGGVLAKASISV